MLRGGRPILRVCAKTILHKNGFTNYLSGHRPRLGESTLMFGCDRTHREQRVRRKLHRQTRASTVAAVPRVLWIQMAEIPQCPGPLFCTGARTNLNVAPDVLVRAVC